MSQNKKPMQEPLSAAEERQMMRIESAIQGAFKNAVQELKGHMEAGNKELRELVERKMEDGLVRLEKYVDDRFDWQNEQMDEKFQYLRDHVDKQFADQRRESDRRYVHHHVWMAQQNRQQNQYVQRGFMMQHIHQAHNMQETRQLAASFAPAGPPVPYARYHGGDVRQMQAVNFSHAGQQAPYGGYHAGQPRQLAANTQPTGQQIAYGWLHAGNGGSCGESMRRQFPGA